MHKCEVCGNGYEQIIEIKLKGSDDVHYFDCFECAAHKLAPRCSQCDVRILGHGLEADEEMFCCAHCARMKGYTHFVDHVELDHLSLPN